MSTRSSITAKLINNYGKIYCHFDGHVKNGVGQMLAEHYNTQDKIEKLIELGDISVLDKTIKDTVFYGRDKNEGGAEAEYEENVNILNSFFNQEYNYFWDGTQWFYGCGKKWYNNKRNLVDRLNDFITEIEFKDFHK